MHQGKSRRRPPPPARDAAAVAAQQALRQGCTKPEPKKAESRARPRRGSRDGCIPDAIAVAAMPWSRRSMSHRPPSGRSSLPCSTPPLRPELPEAVQQQARWQIAVENLNQCRGDRGGFLMFARISMMRAECRRETPLTRRPQSPAAASPRRNRNHADINVAILPPPVCF